MAKRTQLMSAIVPKSGQNTGEAVFDFEFRNAEVGRAYSVVANAEEVDEMVRVLRRVQAAMRGRRRFCVDCVK